MHEYRQSGTRSLVIESTRAPRGHFRRADLPSIPFPVAGIYARK